MARRSGAGGNTSGAGWRGIAAALALVAALSGCGAVPGAGRAPTDPLAADAMPAMRVFGPPRAEAPARTNGEMARDFLDLAFTLESGRELPRFTRFEGPVRLAVAGPVPPTAEVDLDLLLRRLRAEAGIDIARQSDTVTAGIVVTFLPFATMRTAVPQAACFVVPRVGGWDEFRAARGSRQLDWTTLERRERISVFIPSDAAPQEIRDCLNEEIGQALGPLNDLWRLTDSVFNDDNFQTVLTGFDMLMLRASYAPELASGMTRSEVSARVPAILARLNPSGERPAPPAEEPTPRAWITAIEGALDPRAPTPVRALRADRALAIAEARGWEDGRRAFAHFVRGRYRLSRDPVEAVEEFTRAGAIYARLPGTALHIAHIDMQVAALALASGRADQARYLVDRALPAAERGQNAAVLASLLAIKAAALPGSAVEADRARLDSLGWARYGYGEQEEIRSRLGSLLDRATQAGS
jgi:hypothetical protein